jgi:hypothetical protein
MTQKIESFVGYNRFLSNFFPAEIELDGAVYSTLEAAFQARKTIDPDEREKIRKARTPGDAKHLGRKVTLVPDWETIKIGVMRDLVRQKFTRHPGLRAELMDTGDTVLIEGNTWNDTFWGVCRGKGQNWLGKILMEIRAELRGK